MSRAAGWPAREAEALLRDWHEALRGWPNERSLRAGLRATWLNRREALRYGRADAARRHHLRLTVSRYVRLLRAVREAAHHLTDPDPMFRLQGYTPVLTPGRLRTWASRFAHGHWAVTVGPELNVRLWREAVRGFPETRYGVDLLMPEADALLRRWKDGPGLSERLPAGEVVRLLEET